MSRRVLMLGSLPLAPPWDGADKSLAMQIVRHDKRNVFIVLTDRTEQWPCDRVRAVRSTRAGQMPTVRQKAIAFAYLARYARSADLIHVVASIHHGSWAAAAPIRTLAAITGRPIVHTIPSLGDGPAAGWPVVGDVSVVFSRSSEKLLCTRGAPHVMRLNAPIDLERLRPTAPPEDVREQLGLGSRAVLCATHAGSHSGIRELIAAFAKLPPALDDATLVLALRHHLSQDVAHERARILQWAAEAGVAGRLRLLAHVPDMPSLIAACAVTALVPSALASKMDIPLVILESLALGRPVVLTDAPPLREALLGDGGLLVPFGDTERLADALGRLLLDHRRAAALGTRAAAVVRRECDARRVVRRYDEFYALAGLRKSGA